MQRSPGFARGKIRRGYLRRFHKAIHAVDSTTIKLMANCLDWAKYRRRKAAAKCHLRLNLQSYNTLLFYPQQLRRVVALVEVKGEDVEMAFLTNLE